MNSKLIATTTFAILFITFSAANAQRSSSIRHVGFIFSTGTPNAPSIHAKLFEEFRSGLRDLGYEEGKNIVIERRYAEGRLDHIPRLVNELLQQKVDVIVGVNNAVIRAAKEATKTTPIVMITSVDPVAVGYVQSFAHPGGNITGLAWLSRDLSAKRVEFLKDLLPKFSRVGVLWDADGPGPAIAFKEYAAAAQAFKLEFRSIEVRGPKPDLAGAFQATKSGNLDALIVVANPLIGQYTNEVFALAAKYRIATMTEEGRYVEAGGLISYGANLADLYRRAAAYVADILNGAKPGDLPVKLPERFEIFVNLKTAQQIGVAIPQHILIQADKVIK
jgi:ABC-type uncharacterized transport system substrate-binding protein